jgi:hypothetical protein
MTLNEEWVVGNMYQEFTVFNKCFQTGITE